MFYFEDVNAFGCPHCGYRSHSHPIQQGPFTQAQCGECRKGFVVYCGNLPLGPTWQDSDTWGGSPIVMERHPRTGTPSHGKPDKRPDDNGGEFFYPRGVGMDNSPGCFVCGGDEGMYPNVAAFVQCKEAGERVVALFARGARLDYRDFEPDRVQVKIGACKAHEAGLVYLARHVCKSIKAADVELAIAAATIPASPAP
jgi:hypothetical protein